jgi:anti-sigma-K factor RskA
VTPSKTACSECRTLIGGYILGALEPDEAASVARHITECSDCASEYERLADIPDLLTLVGADETAAEAPPAALEEAVLDRFAREHRPQRAPEPRRRRRRDAIRERLAALGRSLRRPLPAAAVGALSAAAVAAALIVAGPLSSGGDRDGWEPGDTYQANLTGSPAAPGARAFAKLETTSAGTRVWLHVRGLRGNPDDLYELWCVRDDGTKVSAGTFRVNARGQAAVDLTTGAVPGEYHRMSVERKPGERVLAGEIQYGS